MFLFAEILDRRIRKTLKQRWENFPFLKYN